MAKAINEIGNRYGRLVVIGKAENYKWLCVCDCGKVKEISKYSVRSGDTKSCGCLRNGGKVINETGNRHGNLLVIEQAEYHIDPKSGNKRAQWLCQCDCGNETIVQGKLLRSGNTKSCGCNQYKKGNNSSAWKGHGDISGTHWGSISWGANYRNIGFDITMEQAWELFLTQDRKCAISGIELQFATERQEEEQTASLDRIDSSRGYTIDNVQWVHKDINIMKKDHSLEYFLDLCQQIVQHQLETV